MTTSRHLQVSVRLAIWLLAFGPVFMLTTVISATAYGIDIVQIEEDWCLVVANPDPDTFAPQVTCTLSPTGNLDSLYAVFDLNLRNVPSYAAGGMQLQLWNGTRPIKSEKSNTGRLLQVNNETITWTQRMKLSVGILSFSIVNGNSQTWGTFGNDNSVGAAVPGDFNNLNQYDPAFTVKNSGIGYSANRVSSLTLVAIRAYSEAKLESVDSTPRVLFQHE